jgi:hypothetical protein
MSGHAFCFPIQKFKVADGKEFNSKDEAKKHIENEIQIYIHEIVLEGLKKENIEIRFSAILAIVKAFADDIQKIDKIHSHITKVLYGKIAIPEEEEGGEI